MDGINIFHIWHKVLGHTEKKKNLFLCQPTAKASVLRMWFLKIKPIKAIKKNSMVLFCMFKN